MVADVGGVHAQLMTSAQLSLWARTEGLTPQQVEAALWEERRLVKTWAMRGTLHLLPTRDFGLRIAHRQAAAGPGGRGAAVGPLPG